MPQLSHLLSLFSSRLVTVILLIMSAVSIEAASNKTWDYIFVGGGLSASVVAHRLSELDPKLCILVIEAGPDANNRSDIVWPNSTNLIGGQFDWNYTTTGQANLDGRSVSWPAGKAMGGGTTINSGGWVRGAKEDFDLWGATVDDPRWSYAGLLPFMRKSEKFWDATINPHQHGLEGPVFVQSVTSTNRELPLRGKELQSWGELGVQALPGLDGNAGDPLGVGELQESKINGRREISSAVYSLEKVSVLANTTVQKVLVATSGGSLTATGVELANGTQIHGKEVILSAGAIRTPQLLKLSGIGPATELSRFGIPVLLDAPEVGANLVDHPRWVFQWNVKDPAAGWAIGSSNPLFTQPQYGWGTPADFIVTTDVPKEGLAAAIAEDEGRQPDMAAHPLLAGPRAFLENVFISAGSADGSRVTFATFGMLVTSRGSVTLASADINDAPSMDPNYLGTAVDRYVAREAVKLQVRFAGSNETVIGREVLSGEAGAPGFDAVLGPGSSDEYIDSRIRAAVQTGYHPMGSAAMGKVVDADLRVKGVDNLRVVDTSIFPVVITAHLQVAAYAAAEQAAEIIFSARSK